MKPCGLLFVVDGIMSTSLQEHSSSYPLQGRDMDLFWLMKCEQKWHVSILDRGIKSQRVLSLLFSTSVQATHTIPHSASLSYWLWVKTVTVTDQRLLLTQMNICEWDTKHGCFKLLRFVLVVTWLILIFYQICFTLESVFHRIPVDT